MNLRNLIAAIGILALLVLSFWWLNQGYGKVSPETYQFSQSLYSACLKKSDEHLEKVTQMLDEDRSHSIPAHELKWLKSIISKAESGQWESAAKMAKRIMDDQVTE